VSGEILMRKFFDFLDALEERQIYYTLTKVNENIMVEIAVPGQRWEVEFLRDGGIQVEKFISEGYLHDESALQELFDF
jgi:hypothetical protein